MRRSLAVHGSVWLALVATPSMLAGQSAAPPPTSATPAPSGSPAPAPAPLTPHAPIVLFLLPALGDEVAGQLREALAAQFTPLEASLVFEAMPAGADTLARQMAQAQSMAAERGAIAAFWIEELTDGRWFVHMMDSHSERIIVRPVDAQGDRRASAIEAVAVMTRESTRALIEGAAELAPVPAPAPPPPPPAPVTPPPAPPSPPPSPRPLRVWAGYLGSDFARPVGLRHGGALGISWLGFAPFYGGLGYLFAPSIGAPVGMPTAVQVQIERVPFAINLGYRYQLGQFSVDGELGAWLEWVIRSSSGSAGAQTCDVCPTNESTRFLPAVCGRLRGEFRPMPGVGIYAGGGLEILLRQFNYVVVDTNDTKHPQVIELLSPNLLRPMAELGLAFYP